MGGQDMKKGMVATLDFVFASVIIILIITAFTFSQKQVYPNLAHVRLANDIYNVLDSQAILSSLDSNLTHAQLVKLLPDNIDANISVTCFNYCSDIGKNCTQKFYTNLTFSASAFSTTSNDVSHIQRFFYARQLYCSADIGVWTR
jgi:hypothetical protein